MAGVKMNNDRRLRIAKQIAEKDYGDNVGVIMLEGTPTNINGTKRWEFKCLLKSNTAEVEKEFYLNIVWKRGRRPPIYEFVDKE